MFTQGLPISGAVKQMPSRQLNNHDDLVHGKLCEDSKPDGYNGSCFSLGRKVTLST